MEHDAYDELTAAYALDALDDDESKAYEEHLAGCEICQHNLAALSGTMVQLAYAAPPVDPRPELRERILAAARAERQAKALDITGCHDSVLGRRILDVRALVDPQAAAVAAAAQRQVLRRPDRDHARQLTQRAPELVERLLASVAIERAIEHDVDHGGAIHPHTRLKRIHVADAAREQRGA